MRRCRLISVIPLFALLFVQTCATLLAHDPGLSSVRLGLETNGLSALLTLARADLESLVPLDKNRDGQVSPDEFAAARSALESLADRALQLDIDHRLTSRQQRSVALDTNGNFDIFLLYPGPRPREISVTSLLLAELPAGHRQIVSLYGGTNQLLDQYLVSADRNHVTLNLDENPDSSAPPERTTSFGQFAHLGIEHILTGYDHLLFLFALLIVCDRFWPVARIITSFTIAHSITLALATFNIVTIPSSIVEPAIAASIVAVSLENILCRQKMLDDRWRLTFGLGLIHGLGFASALQKVGVGRNGTGVALPLIGFNLGVELGQMTVALFVLPILWRLRRWPAFQVRWVPACSAVVATAGAWWFLQRVWDG